MHHLSHNGKSVPKKSRMKHYFMLNLHQWKEPKMKNDRTMRTIQTGIQNHTSGMVQVWIQYTYGIDTV